MSFEKSLFGMIDMKKLSTYRKKVPRRHIRRCRVGKWLNRKSLLEITQKQKKYKTKKKSFTRKEKVSDWSRGKT